MAFTLNPFTGKLDSTGMTLAEAGAYLKLDQSTPQTITASSILNWLTASQLLATDTDKKLVSLSTSTYPSLTELSYLKGVTSAVQTQINTKQSIETITAKTTTYTVLTTDSFLTGSGTFTFTLFTASGNSGKVLTFKNIGTGVITIDANSSETIDSELTYIIRTQNSGVTIISNGTNWLIKGVF